MLEQQWNINKLIISAESLVSLNCTGGNADTGGRLKTSRIICLMIVMLQYKVNGEVQFIVLAQALVTKLLKKHFKKQPLNSLKG